VASVPETSTSAILFRQPSAVKLTTNPKIASVYRDIEQRFERCVQSKRVDIDDYLLPHSKTLDRRRGLTLLARPEPKITQRILETVQTLKGSLGEQYVQAAEDVHTTVYSVVPATANFHAFDPVISSCIDAVNAAINDNNRPFEIEYRGIIGSNDALLVKGYPTTDSLQRLRTAVSQNMAERNLQGRFNLRYPMIAAHATLVRFVQQPGDLSALHRQLGDLKDHRYGTSLSSRLELTEHDWYMRSASLKQIAEYELRVT